MTSTSRLPVLWGLFIFHTCFAGLRIEGIEWVWSPLKQIVFAKLGYTHTIWSKLKKKTPSKLKTSHQSPCWPMARSGWQRWLTSTSCAAHSKTPPNRSDDSFWLRSAGETLISHRSWIVLTESWQHYRSGHPILALAAARTNEKPLCHTRRKWNWQSKLKSRTPDTWLVLCVSMAMPPLWWKQLTPDTK